MTGPDPIPGRLVALDYGRRRIGVAVTDPTRTIASPHGAIRRDPGSSAIPEELEELLERFRPCAVVVGIPLGMDGREGEMAREVRAFAARLETATGIPVAEWDERLSTARAERTLREIGMPRRRRREEGRSDTMAAALMLSDFLRSGRADELARRAAEHRGAGGGETADAGSDDEARGAGRNREERDP